jgi:hypothetical protein
VDHVGDVVAELVGDAEGPSVRRGGEQGQDERPRPIGGGHPTNAGEQRDGDHEERTAGDDGQDVAAEREGHLRERHAVEALPNVRPAVSRRACVPRDRKRPRSMRRVTGSGVRDGVQALHPPPPGPTLPQGNPPTSGMVAGLSVPRRRRSRRRPVVGGPAPTERDCRRPFARGRGGWRRGHVVALSAG